MKITNIFQKELERFTNAFEERKLVGNVMYVNLSENNRLKLEFKTLKFSERYESLNLSVINKNDGVIDKLRINLVDMWGTKKLYGLDEKPFIITCFGKIEWYGIEPTKDEINIIKEQIEDYAEIFMEQKQDFGMSMT